MPKPLIPCPKTWSGQHKFGHSRGCDPAYVECFACGKTKAQVMEERKQLNEDRRMDIDMVAEMCGHFTDCETNNGYGCGHPDNKDCSGECHRTSCPVASYDSDKDEMVVYDEKLLLELLKQQ